MTSQTKLLFNEAIPARTSNRATRVDTPSAIVIEKLRPNSGEHGDSNRSSFNFTILSEESVNTAVMLAKRDLKNMRINSTNQQDYILETSGVNQNLQKDQAKLKASSPKGKPARPSSRPRPKQSKQLSQRSFPTSTCPPAGHKIKNPGLKPLGDNQKSVLGQEICRLQNELELYVKKVEDLANKEEKVEEPLDPEEEKKIQLRKEKQAARSSRFIYDLQHQVKEIQDDIAKLRSQHLWDSNKSTAVQRLAATHRGTLRALQVVRKQIEDLSRGMLPPHHRELCQLIRQLSLCSAKIEVDHGSSVPEATLDVLQKLETLDSAWNKQTLQNTHVPASPPRRRSPHHSTSPHRAPRGASISNTRGRIHSKRNIHELIVKNPAPLPVVPKQLHLIESKCSLVFSVDSCCLQLACDHRRCHEHLQGNLNCRRRRLQKPEVPFSQPLTRGDVLRGCLQRLAQQRGLGLQRSQTNAPHTKPPQSWWRKAKPTTMGNQKQDVGFHQPTVASRLRVNQIPQKELSVPWIPTSPHAPHPARSPERSRPEPRCLFSPEKPPQSPPKRKAAVWFGKELEMISEKKSQEQKEAIRSAWLDTTTTRRLRELDQLSKEEGERIQRLRADIISPTQWAERAEQNVRQKIQPLLDEVKQISKTRDESSSPLRNMSSETAAEAAAEGAEQLSEAILEDLFDGTAGPVWAAETLGQSGEGPTQHSLRAPTLETMLIRMEAIQRDQEDVRRRFASITYSDPQHWSQPEGAGLQRFGSGSLPVSPQPIRFTRPVLRLNPEADIVLERPVDTGVLSENSVIEESPQDRQPHGTSSTTFPGPVERGTATTVLSVPGNMLGSIRRYREVYHSHLQVGAREAAAGFNPWALSDSLAEELLSEAMGDVGAEYQDVAEVYAEAIFTSEFLQPVRSPAASTLALTT